MKRSAVSLFVTSSLVAALLGACATDPPSVSAAFDAQAPDGAAPGETPEAGEPDAETPDAAEAGPPAASIWSTPGACEAALAAGSRNPRQSADALRVTTWNVRFFPDGAPPGDPPRPTDRAWLACTLAWLDADLFVLEEIMAPERSEAALRDLARALGERTGGDWRTAVDPCTRGPSGLHVAFLYDAKRVTLDAFETVAWDGGGAGACGAGRRSAFTARATPKTGVPVRVVGVHAKSGADATSFASRESAIAALPTVLDGLRATGPEAVVVAGDFNTMGCETCDTPVTAPQEIQRLEARLPAAGVKRLAPGLACSYLDPIRAGLLDHVLLSNALAASSSPTTWSTGFCADLACDPKGARASRAYAELSDHCPVVVNVVSR